tara:strand:- start:500 stop:1297 length:798 start_codon:yes stop_codon:yes gene_type:complete
MGIKIKYQDPKSTDFGPNDIVINVREGTIFYKSEKGVFKLQGDNLNTKDDIINFGESSIFASKGFFEKPGLGKLVIQSQESLNRFKVGHTATLEVGGHILPKNTASPIYDLGSPNNPWRDLFLSPSSLHFIKTGRGIGFSQIENGFIIEKYVLFTDPDPLTRTILSKENVEDLKAGRTITTVVKDLGGGDTGKSNIIFPEAIMHPNDDSTFTKYTTAGRVGQFVGGTLFFDQNRNGDNNYIALGAADTQIRITGTITASIDGGSF